MFTHSLPPTTRPSPMHLALAELTDLASQLITIEPAWRITLHLDRATLANILAQARHALTNT